MLGEQIRRNQLKNLSQEELQRRINLLAVELKKDYPSISALLHVAIPIYINNSIVLQYENSTVAKIAKERENTFQDVFRKYLGKDVIAKVTMIDKK
jgi:transcriptional regulator with XRE-family HTH domain